MIVKQCQFRGVDETGVRCLPLFVGHGFEKTAEVSRTRLHPTIRDFVRITKPTKSGVFVLVNAMGAGEYWGSNVNGDLFPEKALIHSPPGWNGLSVHDMRTKGRNWDYGYPTFMGAYPYKHHVNKDPTRAFGRVDLAVWNPEMHRVELVVYLDRALCKKFDAYDLIERVENGEFPDVSMGCKVPYDVCTICGTKSKTRHDYCEHASKMMNKILPDGRKVAVRNDFPKFFDISFVFIGADKTAKVMAKLAQKGNQVCMGDYCTISRSSAEVGEVFSKEASLFQDMKQELMGDEQKSKAKTKKVTSEREAKTSTTEMIPERTNADTNAEIEKMGSLQAAVAAARFLEKQASWKRRAVSSVVGGAAGAGASLVGNHVVKADKESKKKDAVKDGVAGAILGAAFAKKASLSASEIMELGAAGLLSGAGIGALLSSHKISEEKKKTGRDPKDWEKRLATSTGLGGVLGTAGTLGTGYLLSKLANDPIKKKVEHQGVPIHLEWLKGETREYKDKKTGAVKYKRFMTADYGYIPNTKDADGEEIDVYLGPAKKSRKAFVVKQLKKDGSFDENKVMIGYKSGAAAKESYMHHMRDCPECFGDIHEVDVGTLQALFGENGKSDSKEKHAHACECHGACTPCGGSSEKAAAAIFSISPEKYASHRKLSEILKDIPAGPFTKETLPRLESSEKDIPTDVLDRMGKMSLSKACSTPAMMGIVLKPREFQRIVLIQIGDKDLADKLDQEHMTFGPSSEVDESIPVGADHVDPLLKDILCALMGHRSAAGEPLRRRASKLHDKSPDKKDKTSDAPVMKKLAAAYNGYRRALVKKAAEISQFLTSDPQLHSDLFGESMAKAFACGIDKVSTASVLSPDSLAYLVGAYTQRDLHLSSKEAMASLARTGAVVEAA